jgi:hypothetical protein
MGAIFAFFMSKKHANVDVECNGCALHVDDKSSSSEEEAPVIHKRPAMLEKSARGNGDD